MSPAIALAIAAGTGAYAMRDGTDEPVPQATNDVPPAPEMGEDPETGGDAFAAICAADQPDCDDTVDIPLGDFGTHRCYSDAVDCVDTNTCVTTLPAPMDEPGPVDPPVSDAEDLPLTDVDTDAGAASEPTAAPELTPEEQARLEDERAREIALCTQPEPCVPGPAVDCGPVDECVPGPAVDCSPVDCVLGPADECLPPNCAVSSDGAITCPPSEPCILPAPDLPEETIIERCGVDCSNPGFDPSAPQSAPATDSTVDVTSELEPCPLQPSPGGGADGTPPQIESDAPESAPVE